MKAVSFNVNGIRARFHQLEQLIKSQAPDIIGLQEIKVHDNDFPKDTITDMGYHIYHYGQKTHYGVGIMSKKEALNVVYGNPEDTDNPQKRFIAADFEFDGKIVTIINCYFPQGESSSHEIKYPAKRKFYADVLAFLNKKSNTDNIILMGDFNVAYEDSDIGIGADNAKRWMKTGKCSFLPEEREWMKAFFDWGLFDCYRKIHGDKNDVFSWFDYRSKGFEAEPKRGLRIDTLLVTKPLFDSCYDAGIDYQIRSMEKPSDHAPVFACCLI